MKLDFLGTLLKEVGLADLIELMIIALVIGTGVAPFVIVPTALYLELDGFCYAFKDVFGADVLNNDTQSSISIATFIVRLILLTGVFECCRIFAFTVPCIYLVTFFSKTCANILNSKHQFSLRARLSVYTQLKLIMGKLGAFWDALVSTIISATFWLMTINICVTLKGMNEVPILLYLVSALFSVVITLVLFIWLAEMSEVGERLGCVGRKWENEVNFGRLVLRQNNVRKHGVSEFNLKIMKLEVRAQRPIRIMYRPFLVIQKGFVVNAGENFLERLFSILIIF